MICENKFIQNKTMETEKTRKNGVYRVFPYCDNSMAIVPRQRNELFPEKSSKANVLIFVSPEALDCEIGSERALAYELVKTPYFRVGITTHADAEQISDARVVLNCFGDDSDFHEDLEKYNDGSRLVLNRRKHFNGKTLPEMVREIGEQFQEL
jgi:hypothetical protein